MTILLWIVVCSWLNISGWILSAVGQLNSLGYMVALAGLIIIGIWLLRFAPHTRWRKAVLRFRWRVKRLLPCCYFALAALVILGGLLHSPNNYDALAYRIPRILSWLSEGQWHWIHTIFHRLNTRACGTEWVSTPLILFTGSDRLLFLPNAISFLLFPGLSYSILTRLRVSRRVAWQWMWLLPTGYCYLLQAGGIGNDLFGTVLALCAIDLALRSQESDNPALVWFSILAAAVMTAGKTNNITLGLCWLVVLFVPFRRAVGLKPLATAAIIFVGCLSSFLPSAILNQVHCGDWSGAKAENLESMTSGSPLLRIVNNLVLTGLQNVVPPVFPMAQQWNDFAPTLIPDWFEKQLSGKFEQSAARWQLSEMQMEEGASLGLGILLLLFVGVVRSFFHSEHAPFPPGQAISRNLAAVFVALAAIGFLAFCAKSGFIAVGRYFGFYFPFLLPAILWLPGFRALVKSRVWRTLIVISMVMALMLLIISPARPLWPAQIVIHGLKNNSSFAGSKLVDRAEAVYATYSLRNRAFEPLVQILPPERVIGVFTFDDPETSLWRPFGSRIIKHVLPGESADSLRSRGIRYVAVSEERLAQHSNVSLPAWIANLNAVRLQTIYLPLRARSGLSAWTLVEIRP